METVDAAADRGGAPVGATLASELIARAAAIGAGKPESAASALLPAIQAELTARRAAKLSHAKAATSAATAPKHRTKRKDP